LAATALLRLRRTPKEGMRLILDGVFNHSGDSHAWFDRHNQSMGGACHNPDSPQRDWYSFNEEGRALDWLGYPACRSWISSRQRWSMKSTAVKTASCATG
jgi:glycosidase